MSLIHVADAEDPRLDAYRNLKGRGDGFPHCIAEGPLVVERLLTSPLQVESVLLDDRFLDRFGHLAEGREVLVVTRSLLEKLAGFHFHRGVLAAAPRPPVVGPRAALQTLPPHAVIVVCPEINGPENLGSIYRVAAAFGAAAIVLGERCCDHLSRRCLRVSMGAALSVTTAIAEDLCADLRWMRDREIELLAAVVHDDDAESLRSVRTSGPVALVLGTEADGLHARYLRECTRRVTIPMVDGFEDSLNVGVAAGVLLFQLTQAES